MKKEELVALGIDEEVVKQIMSINGKDIEKAKATAEKDSEKLNQKIQNLESELNSKDELINNYNSEIEKFKGMDIDSIKNKVAELEQANKDYESQLKTSREEFEAQLKANQYDFAIKEYANKFEYQSDFVKEAFLNNLKSQGFKLSEDGKLFGADDYQKDFAEKNAGVFKVAEVQKPTEPTIQQFAAPTNNGVPQKGMSLLDAMKAANSNQAVDISQVGKFVNQ